MENRVPFVKARNNHRVIHRMLTRVVWSHYECDLGVSWRVPTLQSRAPDRWTKTPSPFLCLIFFSSLRVRVSSFLPFFLSFLFFFFGMFVACTISQARDWTLATLVTIQILKPLHHIGTTLLLDLCCDNDASWVKAQAFCSLLLSPDCLIRKDCIK